MDGKQTLLIFTYGLLCVSHISAQCDSGGFFFNSKCYYLQSTRRSQSDARTQCQTDYSGTLATIANSQVQNFLTGRLNSQTDNIWRRVWVDGSLQKVAWHWTQDKETLFGQGCFIDTAASPMFTDYNSTGTAITQSSCVETCENRGFDYAGVKFDSANIVRCTCGRNFPRNRLSINTNCNRPCPSDANQKCGEIGVQRVYYVRTQKKLDLWVNNQPNDASGVQFCGIMDGSISNAGEFFFSDENCDNQYYYICQIPNRNAGNCNGTDFFYDAGVSRCFYSRIGSDTYPGAAADCRARGGFLAKIDTRDVYDAAKSILNGNQIGRARLYIGLMNTQWTWNTGAVFGYTSWGQGRPRFVSTCMVMNGDDGYTWSDENCATEYPYICEKATAAPPTTTQRITRPPTTVRPPTPPPSTRAPPTRPPVTTVQPTNPPTTQGPLTNPPASTAAPTAPPTATGGAGGGSTTNAGGASTGNQGGTPEPGATPTAEPSTALSTGVLVAIVVACIAVFVAIVRLLVYCATKRKRNADIKKGGADNMAYVNENGPDNAVYSEIDRSTKIKNRDSTGSDPSQNNDNGPDMLYAY